MDSIQIAKKEYSACVSSFESIILSNDIYFGIIKISLQGKAEQQNIRPMAWRLFLNIIPNNSSIFQWVEALNKQRLDYKHKKNHYLSTKKLMGDPLGVNSQPNINTGKVNRY